MMKKNFIYSLCILLCGALFMSSCEDMLEVESDRVDYDMTDLTLNDTVYSVLGILKSVQQVADRQVLFGELRGDLMVVNEKSATTEIQEIARFALNANSENKYLDIKDYYSIINNCNVFLKRVQKNLNAERDGKKPLLKEFVGVKSVRAWAYMQLAMNYGSAHYFTEPILTHSVAEEIANTPALTMQELAPILIEDLEPYANPNTYPMPNFPGLSNSTELYFVPIRQLLGDLCLWNKQYKKAAENYYSLIFDNQYVTNVDTVVWSKNDVKDGRADGRPMGAFSPCLSISKTNTTAAVVFSSTADLGTVSELESVLYAETGNPGSHMVTASPAIFGLSKNQVYFFDNGETGNKLETYVNPSKEYPGDLRIYSTTDETLDRENGVTYTGLIQKLGRGSHIKLGRPAQIYLRLAEALLGLQGEGYEAIVATGKKQTPTTPLAMSMDILEKGLNSSLYILRKPIGTKDIEVKVPMLDENGDTVYIADTQIPDSVTKIVTETIYDQAELNFSYSAFDKNTGIHSRGSGNSKLNPYYSLSNDSCIALYFNKEAVGFKPQLDADGNVVTDENGAVVYSDVVDYGITDDDKVNYVRNLIIDEAALELAFEGYRFTDLIRFAETTGDVDVLAKRVAGRAYENSVNYYNSEYQYDAELYQKLIDKANWYIPVK